MNKNGLQLALNSFQTSLFSAINTAEYNGNKYENGQKAKEALIRSQTLIMNIHECVKVSLDETLAIKSADKWSVHPPLSSSSPELKLFGMLKGKTQDIVFLRDPKKSEVLKTGPNSGETDFVGKEATKRSIVVGIRSQISSVNKNFDTLMERAFAETLNLRLRTPEIIMGEVYLLPLFELDDKYMKRNILNFKDKAVDIPKFVKIFSAFSGRNSLSIDEQYKYDASALIIADFKANPPDIIFNKSDLKNYGYTDKICELFSTICGDGFDDRLATAL